MDERSEPHTRLLYDLNEVRARSKAFRPEAIANYFNPLPFRYINILGGAPVGNGETKESAFYDAYCSEGSDLFSDTCELAACDDLFRILVSGGDFLCKLAESVEWDASLPSHI